VEQIGKEEITLSHGPIPTLQWGPMTMGFTLPAAGLPANIAVGSTVAFTIRQTRDGKYQILTISPTAAVQRGDPEHGTSHHALQDPKPGRAGETK
jgi:Cu(I)/Ag(I) efflux system membrane fusion protein